MTGALRDFTSHSLWASPIAMNWSLPSKFVSACVYLASLNPLVILIISRPTEVDNLKGDASRAKKVLDWKP
ncbi:hypothetical protein SO802_024118 [Lithocarpus litseifolius]|uniref:Uncharacterized protein n=1 Tax=Lithocarpus litseifolius TaxID=425828 RepID=A0AAW2C803_9ROSI